MPRAIRMPTMAELPRGPVRDFVEELFVLFRAAHRPTLREISSAIAKRDDIRGTASTETIRRMLRGTVPSHWTTVEAVLFALCDIAGADPDAQDYERDREGTSRRESLEYAWHRALDEPEQRYVASDPWATGPGEPPF